MFFFENILTHLNIFLSGFIGLPNDYRALLNTPRCVKISSVGGGHLWYNGIANNLRNVFSNLNSDMSIALIFNVDGLPLFNSSQKCFWPILATIHGKNEHHFIKYIYYNYLNVLSIFYNRITEIPKVQPMIVAIWCGCEKPKSLNEYLREFVTELNDVIINGIMLNGHRLTVKIHCFICDTPARAFLKGEFSSGFCMYFTEGLQYIVFARLYFMSSHFDDCDRNAVEAPI